VNSHQKDRNFGGISFPDRSEPSPGPLSQLVNKMNAEQPPVPPSPAVAKMLSELPPTIRTVVLQRRYMQVLDRLAQRWHNPRELKRLFEELIFETEENRYGLSFDAIVELTEFSEYVKRVRLKGRPSVWDEALGLT
jgi:hypothetical protein